MSSAIYCRLAGHSVILMLHCVNSVDMFLAMRNEELMKDPEIRTMTSQQNKYLTVWNIGFQMLYFTFAFSSDLLTLLGRDHLLPKSIKRIRQPFLSNFLFPTTCLIFVVFWPIFIYDRELIFPAFIDKIFSFKSNLIMHFAILPAALWEVAFLPRTLPKSHAKRLTVVCILYAVYTAVLLHNYYQHGIWPYPILEMTFNTIWFPILLAVTFLITLASYYVQWSITTFFWGNKNVSKKKVK